MLKELGFGSVNITPEDFLKPGYIIQLGVEPNRIDLLTSLKGIEFESAWPNRLVVTQEGTDLSFISKADLITNKLAVGRDQDLVDVKQLQSQKR